MMNIVFLATGFIFILLLLIIFYSKESIQSTENKYFSLLAKINLVAYVVETVLQLSTRYMGPDEMFPMLVNRLYLSFYFIFFGVFSIYTFIISLNKNAGETYNTRLKLAKIIIICSIVIGSVLAAGLPQKIFFDGTKMYSYGPGVDVVKYGLFLYVIIWVALLLLNLKRLKDKKYYPIFLVIFFLAVNGVIQTIDPSIVIGLMVGTFVCYTMYFTIENPDIKMLNEMYKNKELMEQGYEDKYNFLFEMTQEARNPLVNINNLSNSLRLEDNPQKIKDGLLTLNNMVRQLDFSINNILNISSLDIQRLKIVNNRYDLEKLCTDLETRIKPEIKPTVKFNLTMPKQMPTFYGDYMKIRQILYSLLVNACKNTENGNINMKVNLIEKYDVARLVFNISDTGSGMPLDKINEILSSTGQLDKNELDNLEKKEFNVKVCQKVVKIMGGNLMIKSNIGEGTEVILTIDQRVYHEKDTSILNQYENAIANYRKVLIVSQNKNVLNIIKKKLTDHQITYSSLYSGADAIDRIKSGKKFDFIIVDDEMKEMSGFMTMKGMQKLEGFKTPIIIMLDEDKEHIKEHYLDDGFKDYILISNLDSDLNRIIEKY